jgi:hypothetical protein
MFWVVGVVALASLVNGDGCTSTPDNLKRVVPYSAEFYRHSTIRRISPPPSLRHRRNVDDDEPVVDFIIDTSTLSNVEQHACGMVYRLILLLYSSPSDRAITNITIVGNPSIVELPGGNIILGTASSARLITIYPNAIPNMDAFMVVLLHEVFHIMGFGELSSLGALSFRDRADNMTLLIDAPSVAHCTVERMNGPAGAVLYSDINRAHWNASNQTWDNDLMLPTIYFGSTALSYCTVKMVLLSRPEWTDRLCDKDGDCYNGQICVTLGRHWIRVCQTTPLAVLTTTITPAHAITQFTVFIVVLSSLWIGILKCHQRPLELKWRIAGYV